MIAYEIQLRYLTCTYEPRFGLVETMTLRPVIIKSFHHQAGCTDIATSVKFMIFTTSLFFHTNCPRISDPESLFKIKILDIWVSGEVIKNLHSGS